MRTDKSRYMLNANRAPVNHRWAIVHIMTLQDELLNPFAVSTKKVRKLGLFSSARGFPRVALLRLGGWLCGHRRCCPCGPLRRQGGRGTRMSRCYCVHSSWREGGSRRSSLLQSPSGSPVHGGVSAGVRHPRDLLVAP